MSAAPGERFEVGDLDAAGVLAFLRDLDEEARRIEAFEAPALAAPLGGPAPRDRRHRGRDPRRPVDVLDADELLGGDGTPAVAAFTPEDLAGVLRDLTVGRRRSGGRRAGPAAPAPAPVASVTRLQVPAWLARRVAQQTRRLPKAGAKCVDDTLAARIHVGHRHPDRVVADATARFDPAEHARREDRGRPHGTSSSATPAPTEFAGTSELWARGDTIALQASTTWSALRPTSATSTATPTTWVPGRSRPSPALGTSRRLARPTRSRSTSA